MTPRIFVGRFDSKFLGVTLRASTKAEAVAMRLQDLSARVDPALFDRLPDDEVITDLSRTTVIDHELRHFHDALLFPMGERVCRSRIHATVNGFRVAMAISETCGDADAMPVPLRSWLPMDQPARDAYLDRLRSAYDRAFRLPELPVVSEWQELPSTPDGWLDLLPDEVIASGSLVALRDYDLLTRYWNSPHKASEKPTVRALDLWEAAAFLCQLEAMHGRSSGSTAERVFAWMMASGPPEYRRAFRLLDACREALGWSAAPRNLLALTVWSQMGPYLTESVDRKSVV